MRPARSQTLCPTGAIGVDATARVALDRGRCILCGACVAPHPSGSRFADALRDRVARARGAGRRERRRTPTAPRAAPHARRAASRALRRSIHIRHVDAGSDGAEEWEIARAAEPLLRHPAARPLLHRGAAARRRPARHRRRHRADARAAPARLRGHAGAEGRRRRRHRRVLGRPRRRHGAVAGGVDEVLPVDVYVPGSPPSPIALLHGLLLAVGVLAGGAVMSAVARRRDRACAGGWRSLLLRERARPGAALALRRLRCSRSSGSARRSAARAASLDLGTLARASAPSALRVDGLVGHLPRAHRRHGRGGRAHLRRASAEPRRACALVSVLLVAMAVVDRRRQRVPVPPRLGGADARALPARRLPTASGPASCRRLLHRRDEQARRRRAAGGLRAALRQDRQLRASTTGRTPRPGCRLAPATSAFVLLLVGFGTKVGARAVPGLRCPVGHAAAPRRRVRDAVRDRGERRLLRALAARVRGARDRRRCGGATCVLVARRADGAARRSSTRSRRTTSSASSASRPSSTRGSR